MSKTNMGRKCWILSVKLSFLLSLLPQSLLQRLNILSVYIFFYLRRGLSLSHTAPTDLFLTKVYVGIKVHSWLRAPYSLYKWAVTLCHRKQGAIIISLHITETQTAAGSLDRTSDTAENRRFSTVKHVQEISGKRRTASPPSAPRGDSESDRELWGHPPPWRILHHHHHHLNYGWQRQTENYRRLRWTKSHDHSELALRKGLLPNDATNASKWEGRRWGAGGSLSGEGPVRVHSQPDMSVRLFAFHLTNSAPVLSIDFRCTTGHVRL